MLTTENLKKLSSLKKRLENLEIDRKAYTIRLRDVLLKLEVVEEEILKLKTQEDTE